MVDHAFWVDEFPYNLHEADGRHLMALHQLIFGIVFGRHPNL